MYIHYICIFSLQDPEQGQRETTIFERKSSGLSLGWVSFPLQTSVSPSEEWAFSEGPLPAHLWGSASPTHLLDHDAVHAHGLEPPRVVEHVRPAQGHGQHEAGEVLFVGKQVQEDRQYHKHSLGKTVQETQETRALLTSPRHQGSDVQTLQPPLSPEQWPWWVIPKRQPRLPQMSWTMSKTKPCIARCKSRLVAVDKDFLKIEFPRAQ